jgi:hypothetical protein
MIWDVIVKQMDIEGRVTGAKLVGSFATRSEAMRLAAEVDDMFTEQGWDTAKSGRRYRDDDELVSYDISTALQEPLGRLDEPMATVGAWTRGCGWVE